MKNRCSFTNHKLLIVARDFDEKTPFLFGSLAACDIDWDASLSLAIEASTAMPSYFLPVSYRLKRLVAGKPSPSLTGLLHGMASSILCVLSAE